MSLRYMWHSEISGDLSAYSGVPTQYLLLYEKCPVGFVVLFVLADIIFLFMISCVLVTALYYSEQQSADRT